MERLELKHISGYLPYGLKYKDIPKGYEGIRLLCIKTFGWCLLHGKPILRPISDLTKEIEFNGEKFVPILELKSQCSYAVSNEIDKFVIYKNYGDMPYWIIQKLYEWHFDIHGLIEKGLAIDFNTLNKQP